MKTALFASAAVIAMISGAMASRYPAMKASRAAVHVSLQRSTGVLYSQNSNYGTGVRSANFTGSSAINSSSGADDFVVPASQTWHVTEVDVAGNYGDGGTGEATSEVVTFYKNRRGRPGKVIGTYTLNCTDISGNFSCTIPGQQGDGQELRGHKNGRRYWVGVVANCEIIGCDWYWSLSATDFNGPGQFENPGGGYRPQCRKWKNTSDCSEFPPNDYVFTLQGSS